jgi:hypothetical protein
MKRSIGLLIGVPLAALALGATACGSSSNDASSGTTVTTAASTDTTMGDSAAIETVQQDLNAVGCWAGAVDGEDGPRTVAAIRQFQKAEGLTVDGELGTETMAALQKAATAGTKVCSTPVTTAPAGATTTTAAGGGSGACAQVTEAMVAETLPGITDLKWSCALDSYGFPWVGGYGTDQGQADVNFILENGADVPFIRYDMAKCTNPPVPQSLLTWCESN